MNFSTEMKAILKKKFLRKIKMKKKQNTDYLMKCKNTFRQRKTSPRSQKPALSLEMHGAGSLQRFRHFLKMQLSGQFEVV